MAERGWNVTLLEKDEHPRFHIGESLLPMNLPIFEKLGVLARIREIGVVKRGADFTHGNTGDDYTTYHFERALGHSPDHAFEVRRSDFDAVLFENCVEKGVDAREQIRVTDVQPRADGKWEVEARTASGESLRWLARFLVDASGRDTFLASSRKWKRRNRVHASAAVFGHFKGVTRRPSEDSGNISIYWFEHGWIWMIPLPDDVMSVGVVAFPQYLKTRKGSLDEFLQSTLDGIDEIRVRMNGAEAVIPAQAAGNYSYSASRPVGPGYLLIGDAYAFIDPVFSSGVYLAMSSAERATSVVEAWLRNQPFAYRLRSRSYRKGLSRGLSTFSWFIYRFNTPAMRQLMNNPRNVSKVVQAVISMLAGDVYSNRIVRRRLWVFKSLYYMACIRHWRETLDVRRSRRAGVRLDMA